MTGKSLDMKGIRTEDHRRALARRGTLERVQAYQIVFARTHNHRTAIAAYCAGNWHLEQAAKAVGNWPRGG